jgi:hypothetical protein
MPSNQEIFDTVARAILKQGAPSVIIDDNDSCSCRYRGVNGAKCAVGHLINDDEYCASMEDMPVLLLYNKNMLPERLRESINILLRLQAAHDNAVDAYDPMDSELFIYTFIENMCDIAEHYDLNTEAFEMAIEEYRAQ